MCLICQEKTTEPLKCPLNAKGSEDKSEAYRSFLNNVSAFRALETLPVVLTFEEGMTAEEMVQNQGAWHKTCYLKFNDVKLERAKKRGRDTASENTNSGKKQPRCQSVDNDEKFGSGCQQQSVPSTLKTLVSMLLNGANLRDQDCADSQANLTISQTILFNFKKHASFAKSLHSLDREPPLPLYIRMKIHTETKSKNKKIITQLYDLGLSVSYNRVLQLESQLATAVCEDFLEKKAVVPASQYHGLFTTGTLDNMDHNPSSTTAKGSFHGTGISRISVS